MGRTLIFGCILKLEQISNRQLMRQSQENPRPQSKEQDFQRKFEDYYALYKTIGQGAYGKVYRAINRSSNRVVAAKMINLLQLKRDDNEAYHLKALKREIQFMMNLNHKNIIAGIDQFKSATDMVFVMEYCTSNLIKYITKTGYSSEKQVLDAFQQIVEGLNYLHSKGIMHRDLKCQNILVHNRVYKICDLGFCRSVKPEADQQNLKMSILGTTICMAPEVNKHERYGFAADIWSLGTVLFCMFYGKYPVSQGFSIDSNNINEIESFLKKNSSCHGFCLSKKSIRLIKLMLNEDKSHRINCEELLYFLNSKQSVKYLENTENISQQKVQELIMFMEKQLLHKDKFHINCHLVVTWLKKMENSDFAELLEILFLCLKTDQMYKYAIEFIKIISVKLGNSSKRSTAQFSYLIFLRCFNDLNSIDEKIKTMPMKKGNQLQTKIVEFFTAIKPIIQGQFDLSSCKLTAQESKWDSMLEDRLRKTFQKKKFEQKQRFFVGLELQDYSQVEQIEYMETYYRKHILPQLKQMKMDYVLSPVELYKELKQFTTFGKSKFTSFRQIIDKYFKTL